MESEQAMMHDDRRLGLERRSYKYSGHFPERRMRNDRRSGIDRRAMDSSQEKAIERRAAE